ncbi:hypothetical protein HZB60_03395 [candidate division KSB1 bacterium]|nr:hypothetical protein [candidate division KSB1 bacterium]
MLEDLKTTVREGLREMRDRADDLARQGRLRMDMFQAERRLKAAQASLGEAVFGYLIEGAAVSLVDPRIEELVARVRYYQDELNRLTEELKRVTG